VIESSILDNVNARNLVVLQSTREARLHLDTPIVITRAGRGRSQFMERVAIEDMSEIWMPARNPGAFRMQRWDWDLAWSPWPSSPIQEIAE
jgi:hypothetical protein